MQISLSRYSQIFVSNFISFEFLENLFNKLFLSRIYPKTIEQHDFEYFLWMFSLLKYESKDSTSKILNKIFSLCRQIKILMIKKKFLWVVRIIRNA